MNPQGLLSFVESWENAGAISKGIALGVVLGGGYFASLVLYAIYNVFLHPLRRYPGPLLWRAFRVPYVISIHRGDIHRKMKRFHDEYGSVVRIAPNELSYVDGRAWKDVYGNRPGHLPFERNRTWFKKLSPDEPHSIMGYDEEAHTRMRRTFVNSFSEKSLRDQSPVIEGYVELLINKLNAFATGQQRADNTVDLNQWLNYFTFDVSGDLSFGESFDCLRHGKAHAWVEIAQDFGKALSLIASINLYPPFHKLLRYVIPKKIMQRSFDHRAMSAAKARERLSFESERPDFVTPAQKYNKHKPSIFGSEWEINMAIIVFAGSETAGSALTAVMRELVQNRGVMSRLTEEVRGAFEDASQITIAATGNLVYMNAVINEGLRLDPPVVIGVPRLVPAGGDTVCGQWVPGGTYVAYNQFAANRQSRNFSHPNSFIPERFINPDTKTDDMTSLQPFGIGRHSCIGTKLAYAEMRLVLARLLFAFDIALADETDRWDWGEQKTYILWDKRPLRVTLRPSSKP